MDVTGGEPFLRPDLGDLFAGIGDLKHSNLKHLKAVAVTTNGFLTRRVVAAVEDLAGRFRRESIELVMVCAMDAAGPVYEQIRRVKDAWPKLNETIHWSASVCRWTALPTCLSRPNSVNLSFWHSTNTWGWTNT